MGFPWGEVQVRPQVVDPEFRRPRLFVGGGFSIKKEDVRLHALGVEDAGGQPQQRVDVEVVEQSPAQRFTDAALEEDVVGQDDGGPAVLLEDREDVLQEV